MQWMTQYNLEDKILDA